MLMKTLQAKFVDFVKKHKIMSIVLTLIIALCLWWAWGQFAPHPLGNRMEYLGKEDYGNIFGFDSAPNSIYYYGTDMEPKDMEKYFTATYSPLEGLAFKNSRFTVDNKEFVFTYESSSSFSTSKKYVVSISYSQYNIAKNYLKK